MNGVIKENGIIKSIKRIVYSKCFVVVLCSITIIFGALYYYGLQMAFIPDAEDLLCIWSCYKIFEQGGAIQISSDIIGSIVIALSTAIGGISFLSLRLLFTLLQSLVLILSMYLSFYGSKGQDIYLFRLPIFILLMILLHPVTQEDPYGLIVDCGTDFFYQYPYNYHFAPRIYMFLCLILLSCFFYAKSLKHKLLSATIFAIFTTQAVLIGDTLFFVLFLAPLCIVVILRILHNSRVRKYGIYFLSLFMGVILLLKVIPTPLKSQLWTTERALTYGNIYGGTNWITPDQIWTTIVNYVIKILDIFNILLPSKPLISLYTVINVLKLLLLIVGYIIVIAVVKGSIIGEQKWKTVNIVDEILAWSYVALSTAHIFTEYGQNVIYSQRYIQAVVSIMTILLCRHIVSFLGMIHWDFKGVCLKEKMAVSFALFALCLCFFRPVWRYDTLSHCHENDMNEAMNYIKETDYGYAIAPFNLAGVMRAMNNGEVLVYDSIEEVQGLYGEDAKIAYMITRYDYEPGKYHAYMYYEQFASYEELCEKYSEPTRTIDYDTFSLCVWENGIGIPD